MSHIARELKMLYYLNDHRNRFVKIEELANLFELDNRQIRRYKDDLDTLFEIESKSGSEGGYKLKEPLDKSLMIPDNIMLAVNVSTKNNESLFKSLKELPVISRMDNVIGGDNIITDKEMDNLVVLVNAIRDNKSISFHYIDRKGNNMDLTINPYKLSYNNHTYYLHGDYKGMYRHYDIDSISNIVLNDTFIKSNEMINTSNDLPYYGIKNDGIEVTLIIEYTNESILGRIERLFEHKGVVDIKNKTYTIKSNSENELFYPLFQLGLSNIKIKNKDFKEKYIKYLETQLVVLKNH